jgi:hypothetical protein
LRATSTPATATTEAAMRDETELDLTKLQDRLYTEEEGKYENLSLVKKFRCIPNEESHIRNQLLWPRDNKLGI